ncbi:MAG: error-prone DNA polymerase [Pseudomonadota bacterium]|nr:error-prone DNA polymerase [Pseudomonadota bacterium]
MPEPRQGATIHVLPHPPRRAAAAPAPPPYAELHCLTHYSFQRGASSPEDLVRRAWALGYTALTITDECSVAGVVRAWKELGDCQRALAAGEADDEPRRLHAARTALGVQAPLRLLYGSEFRFEGRGTLVAIARDLPGWGNLCEFITHARRAADKGRYRLPPLAGALAALQGCELLWAPCRNQNALEWIAVNACPSRAEARFDSKIHLLAELNGAVDDALWLAQLQQLGAATGCPLVAAGDVHLHARAAKRLHDVMTAIRLGRPVADCGFALHANGERHLRPRARLAEVYPPELLAATLAVARRCSFMLEEVRYNYPREAVIAGLTPTQTLRRLSIEGARWRFPEGVPFRIWRYIAKELALIAFCRYEMFFLTVHDIVRWARGRGILCQGRGSAANSVVCYCLGITEADPRHSHPLLERFISRERRHEPPDIDVDFEHERREEVIQYIYRKYGRERAALAATVICYRRRSALRDVGKALGVDEALIDAFAKDHHWFDDGLAAHRLGALARDVGARITPAQVRLWLALAGQLRGAPRHLSQHVGGFVLTETPLTRLVPVENTAMADRQVIQWDKDDLEALGMLKVDVLALGMLTAMRRCLHMVSRRRGQRMTRADIPREDAATYRMIQRADTVGTFQIESRAQMSMLPRLKPERFYDLVVEVAIVRPGPISGGMVHPYLKARERFARDGSYECERSSLEPPGTEPALKKALARTLGVPIFQEQVMEIAIIAAGFSPERADQLRRSMAAWKRKGGVHQFEDELKDGMRQRGYSAGFADRIFKQILGFGEYGFPESHAYSFALIAYESSWLKRHEPEAFLAAMLNSQPMGFYGPAQLIQDAKRHGVTVLPPDVTVSEWDCALEAASGPPDRGLAASARPAVRLGLRLVKSFNEHAAERVTQARAQRAFASVGDLARRARLDTHDLNALAAADALLNLAGHRRQQVWQGAALKPQPGLLRDAPIDEMPLMLPAAPEGEEIVHDYAALGLTLRRHPLALLRPRLARWRLRTADELKSARHGEQVRACGIVIGRQQPGTAKGTIFVTLEDETGPVNVIVWKSVREDEAQRNALLRSRLLAVQGEWQQGRDSDGHVRHLIARRFVDLTPLLGRIAGLTTSRDFH